MRKVDMPNGQGTPVNTEQWYNMNEAVTEIGIPQPSVMANLLCMDMHIDGLDVEFAVNGITIDKSQPAPDYYRAVLNATSFKIHKTVRNFTAILFHGEGRKKVNLAGMTLEEAQDEATEFALCYVDSKDLAPAWYEHTPPIVQQWVKCTMDLNGIHLSLTEY